MSDSDTILCAWIDGTARRLATDKTVTEADAVAQLGQLAAGRADLLAEVAGVSLGFAGDDATMFVTRRVADLCLAAGADREQVQRWIAVGQGRAEHASAVPSTYSGARRRW